MLPIHTHDNKLVCFVFSIFNICSIAKRPNGKVLLKQFKWGVAYHNIKSKAMFKILETKN